MSKKILIGLKLSADTTTDYIDSINDSVDFIEIYATPGEEFNILSSFKKPVVVHVAHFGNGVNFANPRRAEKNHAALKHAVSLADKFNASKIIFHPELIEDESCTIEVLEEFIKNHYDERLHLESMPFSSMGYPHFAASIDEIKYLLNKLGVKFCLDFAHTFEYLAKEHFSSKLMEDYLALKPDHFHITDTDLSAVFDTDYNEQHINFGEGTMDLAWCKEQLPAGSWVTIETPANAIKQLQEVDFLRN